MLGTLNPDTRFWMSLAGILLPMLGLGAYMLWERVMHPPEVVSGSGDAYNRYRYHALMMDHKRRTLGAGDPLTASYARGTIVWWRLAYPDESVVPAEVLAAGEVAEPVNLLPF